MVDQYLTKTKSSSRERTSTVDESNPGTPPRPDDREENCRTETFEVTLQRLVTVSAVVIADSPDTNQVTSDLVMSQSRLVETTETRTREVCDPIPIESPPQPDPDPPPDWGWIIDRRIGWNSGAHSINRVDGDLYLSFQVHPANNLAVGIAPVSSKTHTHHRTMPFAFLFNGGRFRILEKGRGQFGPLAYNPSDTFQIVRIAGGVIFKRNEETVFRSSTPSEGTMIAVSAFYTAEDRVI